MARLAALVVLGWSLTATAKPVLLGPHGNPTHGLAKGTLVVGVMGGANSDHSGPLMDKMRKLGGAIAKNGHVTLTGACPGLPQAAILGAKAAGGKTIGVSGFRDLKAHKAQGAPTEGLDVIKFTSLPAVHRGQARPNYMGRELDEIEHSHALVFAGGRSGTLGEFSIAYEEGRPIGVLTKSGGVTDHMRSLVRTMTKAGKPAQAPVVFDSNPERLVKRLLEEMKKSPSKGNNWQG